MPTLNATSVLLFGLPVIFFLWLDLHLHRTDKPMSFGNAAIWSAAWVALAFAFAGYIGYRYGQDNAWLFITGYLLEQSLSIDNLFVFMAIFASFGIADMFQHRVLYYGIVGAVVLRLVFIALGTSLLVAGDLNPTLHTAVFALFGLVVLWSGAQMYRALQRGGSEVEDYGDHWSVRWTRRVMPVHPHLVGHDFFVRKQGRWHATPLFLCLIAVDVVDVAFAFDSVPAVIAVTREPFLIITSNIFAILGLRSMYFLLTAARRYLCHLDKAVVAILFFIGAKLLLEAFHDPLEASLGHALEISAAVSLIVVVGTLAVGVIASLVAPDREVLAVATAPGSDRQAGPETAADTDTAP
jgi:tellurite resistance protein TerC